MKKLLLGVILLPLFAGTALAGYRAFSRDYRYFQLVQLSDQLLAEGLPFQASRTYGTAIGVRPAAPIAYIKRVEAKRRQGNLSPAVEDLEKAESLSTDVLLISRRLANIYDELGRFDEAALHYERVLILDPESPEVLEKLDLVHFRAEREAEAIEALNRTTSSRTGPWEPFYLRGAVFRALGELDEAEADFLRALELAPDATLARTALIELYRDIEQVSKTMPLVHAETDDNPEATQPYLHLSDVHRLAGHNIDAIEAMALTLEPDPNLPAAYLCLDELWLEEGTSGDDPVALEKAVTVLESVTKMDPSNGRAALALGRAHLAMADEPRTFAEVQRTGVATPVQAEAHRLRGNLYRRGATTPRQSRRITFFSC
jgi:tetratricopeptide (TPR) repeat protein